ncbi:HORMA domain containing protein [Trypanosoma theileri]|uniref:HORMA domain containing protein n=1 Tax=Trypanosoma theileri TaxID=67003 RepID=A0A1X0P8D0_9TRYP|nr:HORMA domain containing protein [Trypanosoma theileri]ORC93095.1 HORMA domain containing protein [Trypanosoma theileri]
MTSTAAEVTQVQSLAAIRNFIRVAVSCVTYLRGLCSDESYQPRQFLGLQLKQLVRTSPEADAISQWMEEGAFDALNKGYLKELALCIYSPNCTELLESYTFTLSYSPDGQRASLAFTSDSQRGGVNRPPVTDISMSRNNRKRRTRQEVQQALASIITKLMEVVEGLPPLLCDRVLTMQLTYYEDITLASYEPPCFAPANSHLANIHEQEKKQSTKIASLDTGHHMMAVTIRHRFFDRLWSQRSSFLTNSPTTTAATYDTAATGTEEEEQETAAAASARTTRLSNKCDMNTAANKQMSTIEELTQQFTNTQTENYFLRPEDLAFLVFTSFVLTKSPAIQRGRISLSEIEEYLRISCPLDISLKKAQQMMKHLEAEAVVVPGMREEWVISPVPAATLARSLLAQEQVVPLLSAQIQQDLKRLITDSKSSRVSVAGKRKRLRQNSS